MAENKKDEWELLFSQPKEEKKVVVPKQPTFELPKMLDRKALWLKLMKNWDILILLIAEIVIVVYLILALLGFVPFF